MAHRKLERKHKTQPPIESSEGSREMTLPAMPVSVSYRAELVDVRLEQTSKGSVFKFKKRGRPDQLGNSLGNQEVFELRRRFIEIVEPGQALDFLAQSGWLYVVKDGDGGDYKRQVSWEEFQAWQRITRSFMVNGPIRMQPRSSSMKLPHLESEVFRELRARYVGYRDTGLLTGIPKMMHILPKRRENGDGPPHLSLLMSTFTTVEAILTACCVDEYRGVRHQVCALRDCLNVYEVTSNHDRLYCSNAHAHKASVRRRRAEARIADLQRETVSPQEIRGVVESTGSLELSGTQVSLLTFQAKKFPARFKNNHAIIERMECLSSLFDNPQMKAWIARSGGGVSIHSAVFYAAALSTLRYDEQSERSTFDAEEFFALATAHQGDAERSAAQGKVFLPLTQSSD